MQFGKKQYGRYAGWKLFLKLSAGIMLVILLYLSGIEKSSEPADVYDAVQFCAD